MQQQKMRFYLDYFDQISKKQGHKPRKMQKYWGF